MTASVDASATDAPPRGGRVPLGLQSRIFRQLTVIPALLAMAWLLAGLPLLLLGHFTPVLMLVLFVPLAALLLIFGLRWISGPSHGLLGERGAEAAPTPWWTIAAVVAVAVLFAVDQFIYHSQYIIVMRDPASYLQFGNWIARHGSLPIPQDAAAFGGYNHALSFNTAAFYQVGSVIVPVPPPRDPEPSKFTGAASSPVFADDGLDPEFPRHSVLDKGEFGPGVAVKPIDRDDDRQPKLP